MGFKLFPFLSILDRIVEQALYGAMMWVEEGGTIVGARTTDDLITQRRKYDFSDKIVWKEKTWAPWLTILNRKMQKYRVTDPEPKIMQDGYTQLVFTLNNAAGTGTTFEFTNDEAKLMQAEDILGVVNANAYSTEEMEYCLITNIGAEDSGPAGAGYTSVTVTRAYGTTGTRASSGATGQNIATASQWRIVHMGTTYTEGAGIGESKNVEVTTVQNYTEIIKEAYEVTGTFESTDYYGPVDMQYKARKARKDFFRRLELKFLYGRKLKYTVSGKPKRFTGGAREFMYDTATTQFIDMGDSATPATFNTKFESVFKTGSEEKWLFAGPGLMTLIDNAFSGAAQVYNMNEQLSRRYMVRVVTAELTHGALHIVREQAVADLPIWTKTGWVIDMPYIYYMYMAGRDFQILKDVQTNDKDTTKNALFGEIGMHRSFGESHFWIYNAD